MTKQTKITTPETMTEIRNLDLSLLTLHAINPRQSVSDEEITDLAASIAACGLIQNLSGLILSDGSIGIVAGGRRLRALQLLAKQGAEPRLIPVAIAPDEATAKAWASTENAARKALEPYQEIIAYGQMNDTGATVAAIAKVFAVSEAHVYRRMALANLATDVLEALRDGKISFEEAKIFTLSNDPERTKAALERCVEDEFNGIWGLKTFLVPNEVGATDRRVKFVGRETYEAAGGTVIANLFDDKTLFTSPDTLDRLFAEQLEQAADEVQNQGWAWVNVIEDGYISYDAGKGMERVYPEAGELTKQEAERHDALQDLGFDDDISDGEQEELDALVIKRRGDYSHDQKFVSGGFLCVDDHGKLDFEGGFVRASESQLAQDKGFISAPTAAQSGQTPSKPKFSEALSVDMARARLCAQQTALLEKPALLLDLLAFSLSKENSGMFGNVFGMSLQHPANIPTTETGLTVDERLMPGEYTGRNNDLGKAFVKFQKKGTKSRNAILNAQLARLFEGGGTEIGAMLAKDTSYDLRSVWTPTDENFFKRVTGATLEEIYTHIMGDDAVPTFGKQKKGEKVAALHKIFNDADTTAALSKVALKRRDAWTPEAIG